MLNHGNGSESESESEWLLQRLLFGTNLNEGMQVDVDFLINALLYSEK